MSKKRIKPLIIDNQNSESLAQSINEYLNDEELSISEVQIASAFFNPRGFNLILKSLKEVKKIKIMLGAEPEPESKRVHKLPGDPYDFDELLIENNINSLSEALKDERDSLPFDLENDKAIKNLLSFLKSKQIEVRRYTKKFLHAKAFLFIGEISSLLQDHQILH